MRALLLLSVLFLGGCESYHVFCASQSLGPDQLPHIAAIAKGVQEEAQNKKQTVVYVCEYYPAGMGGFSSTCQSSIVDN